MSTKTPIILNDRITLVSDYSQIKCTFVIPARNIQKMIKATGCSVISKKEVRLPFNHYAGTTFYVTVLVIFGKIKSFLQTDSIYECENKNSYLDLLDNRFHSYNDTNLPSEKIALYAFGRLYEPKFTSSNSFYYNKEGKKISIAHSEWNSFGEKRYIKFKGVWYSNKK